MQYTFAAEFGDFKIEPRQAHITISPTEENEIHVMLFDLECDIKNFFAVPPFPKGKASIQHYIKVPPKCPNCQHELTPLLGGHYERQNTDRFNYNGVSVDVIPSYNEDIIELRLHYETLEYESCYPPKTS